MTCTSIRGRSHSRPDSEWPGEWRCESNSDVPESLGAKTNRLQRVLRGRSDAVHAVFVEFQGTVNPQGYHLRTPKNCPSAWGHLSAPDPRPVPAFGVSTRALHLAVGYRAR